MRIVRNTLAESGRAVIGALLAVSCLVMPGVAQRPIPDALVDIGGHKLNVRQQGTSKPGVPIVVFENGFGTPLPSWTAVQNQIAADTRTVAYDRAGIGASEPGPEPRTPARIAAELHSLLAGIDAPPPYVLVGHSYGGPLVHAFAATYPKEVAGLVYVDPTDFTQTNADIRAIWEKVGAPDGREALGKIQEKMVAAAPPGVQAEGRELLKAERGGFAVFRDMGEAPAVPMVILLAGKIAALPSDMTFPGNFDRFTEALAEQRLDHFGRMAKRSPNGLLLLVGKSGHFIQLAEPDTVAWAVRRVLAAASAAAKSHQFRRDRAVAPREPTGANARPRGLYPR